MHSRQNSKKKFDCIAAEKLLNDKFKRLLGINMLYRNPVYRIQLSVFETNAENYCFNLDGDYDSRLKIQIEEVDYDELIKIFNSNKYYKALHFKFQKRRLKNSWQFNQKIIQVNIENKPFIMLPLFQYEVFLKKLELHLNGSKKQNINKNIEEFENTVTDSPWEPDEPIRNIAKINLRESQENHITSEKDLSLSLSGFCFLSALTFPLIEQFYPDSLFRNKLFIKIEFDSALATAMFCLFALAIVTFQSKKASVNKYRRFFSSLGFLFACAGNIVCGLELSHHSIPSYVAPLLLLIATVCFIMQRQVHAHYTEKRSKNEYAFISYNMFFLLIEMSGFAVFFLEQVGVKGFTHGSFGMKFFLSLSVISVVFLTIKNVFFDNQDNLEPNDNVISRHTRI